MYNINKSTEYASRRLYPFKRYNIIQNLHRNGGDLHNNNFPKVIFYIAKDRLLHAKRPPFARRKSTFCNVLNHRRVNN